MLVIHFFHCSMYIKFIFFKCPIIENILHLKKYIQIKCISVGKRLGARILILIFPILLERMGDMHVLYSTQYSMYVARGVYYILSGPVDPI